MWNIPRNAAAVVLIAALLGGCGSSHEETPANRAAATRAKKALDPKDALTRSLVGAVTATKPGTSALPVQVKFALLGRPEVAQPLDIDLAIVPTANNLDRISGRVEGEEGLELIGSGELAPADKPLENTPIEHTIKVLPKQNGMYILTATVSVDVGGQISTQLYSIPVIAGTGIPDLPTKPPTPGAAATTASASAPATAATR
jgi:hypothetical protein